MAWITLSHESQAAISLSSWEVEFDSTMVLAQSAELSHHLSARRQTFTSPNPPQTNPTTLQLQGWRLYRSLPDEIRAILEQLDSPLLIATNEFELPWELLYDGAEFLSMVRPLGRQLLTPKLLPRALSPPFRKDWQMLLIANPTGDLESTIYEVELLADLVERIPGTRPPHVLANQRATRSGVIEALSSGDYDIIHYAGHAFFAQDATGGLRLADDEILSVADIRKYLHGQPVVFLNACESAKETAARSFSAETVYPGIALQGLAGAFLESGARAFIGSLWRIRNDNACIFAQNFYRQALQGECVGEALRQARKITSTEIPDDPLWAAFVLYGDPRLPVFHLTKTLTRTVTVLAARITGSADVYAAWDLPSAADFMGKILDALYQKVISYHGEIISLAHDTLIAVFGLSATQTDHAKLALYAGLDMRSVLQTQPDVQSPAPPYAVNICIGVDTDRVRLYASNSADYHNPLILGTLIEQAYQLRDSATPGQILIGIQTYQETLATFDFTSLSDKKQQAYALIQIKPRHRRLLSFARTKTPLVGRTAELALLDEYWRRCRAGHKQSLILVGAAGMGKSRLLHEFIQSVNLAAPLWLLGVCHAHLQHNPLSCLAQLIADLLGVIPDDSPQVIEAKLKELFGQLGFTEPEIEEPVTLFCEVLGVRLAARHVLSDPKVRRGHLVYYLKGILTYLARTQSVLIVLEDAHWIDNASQEILSQIFNELPDSSILLIALQRPGRTLDWENEPYNHIISLSDLTQEHCEAMLCNLLKIDALPQEIRSVLIKTEGNPFFLEEIVATLQEIEALVQTHTGWQLQNPVAQMAVSPSIQSVLLERVNRLKQQTLEVIQAAAVVGQVFPYTLLITLTTASANSLDASLNELKQHGLIEDRSELLAPKRLRQYIFRHALIQDVIYNNLAVAERQRYHRRIARRIETLGAQVFEELYAEQRAGYIEVLAQHTYHSVAQFYKGEWQIASLTAEDYQNTIGYLLEAATKARQQYAHQEATTFYQQALLVLSAFSGDTDLQAAQCYEGLGEVLHLQGDFAAAAEHLLHAYNLLAGGSDLEIQRKAARIAARIGRIYERQGGKDNLTVALTWRDKGLALLPENPLPETAQLYALGGILHFRNNDFKQATLHLEQALTLAHQAHAKSELRLAHSMLSMVYHASGQLEAAMQHCQVSIELDQELEDAIGLAKDYSNQGVFAFEMDNWQLAKDSYLAAVRVLERVGDQYQWAITTCNLADMYCHLGELEEGLCHARRGLDTFSALRAYPGMILAHTILATLYWRQGNLDAAKEQMLTAQALETTHNVTMFHSTVGRWLAQIYLTMGNVTQAQRVIQNLLTLNTAKLADEAEPIQHLHAQLLAAEGDIPTAICILETSVARLEEQRMQYQTGQAWLILARLLMQTNQQNPKARAYARRAYDVFAALGAQWDVQEAAKLIQEWTP